MMASAPGVQASGGGENPCDAGIVIVTHNSEPEIGECLDRALATGAKVVVVDNASTDRTRSEVLRRPGVRLLSNPWNRGFAAAVNQGIGALDCGYVLLLNPDAVLLGGIAPLVEACAGGAAAAAGKLVDDSGRAQAGFTVRRLPSPLALVLETLGVNRLWPRNPVNRHYRCLDLDLDAPALVEQPAGAFLMVRRDDWRRLGGFDESFRPVWFEDVDFCKRIYDLRRQVAYVPAAVARHKGAHSVGKLRCEERRVCWYDTLLKYTAKHFGLFGLASICLAVAVRSVAEAVLGIFLWRSAQALSAQAGILHLAIRYFFRGRSGKTSLPAPTG